MSLSQQFRCVDVYVMCTFVCVGVRYWKGSVSTFFNKTEINAPTKILRPNFSIGLCDSIYYDRQKILKIEDFEDFSNYVASKLYNSCETI